MDRIEFLKELAQELTGMPEEERAQALQFYNEYLEDAGEENVQTVLEELGSPKQLAQQLIANCGVVENPLETAASAKTAAQPEPAQPQDIAAEPQKKQQAAFQEAQVDEKPEDNGAQQRASAYQYTYTAEEDQTVQPPSWNGGAQQSRPYEYNYSSQEVPPVQKASGIEPWVWILIFVVAAPLWLGLLGAALGVVGAVLGITAAGVGLLIGGVVAFFASFGLLSVSIAGTMVAAGVSLVCVAVGIVLTVGMIWSICKLVKLVPKGWRWLKNTMDSKWR